LLGALRDFRQTAVGSTRLHPQLYSNQFHHVRAAFPADFSFRKNRYPAPRRHSREPHFDHLSGEIGVALAQTLQLLCPVGAMALSAWIFHERLATAQLWSAAILLAGAFLAMRTKPVATTESAENI